MGAGAVAAGGTGAGMGPGAVATGLLTGGVAQAASRSSMPASAGVTLKCFVNVNRNTGYVVAIS